DHDFITFAPHLFDEDGDLHFASRIDLEGTGHFRVFHLKRNIAAGLADEALTNVPRGHKLSFASGERRIVHQNPHPDRGRIDVDELKWRMFFPIGQGLADVNFLEPSQANDIADAGMLQLDLTHSGKGVEAGDAGALAPAIAVNANDRVTHAHAPAHDPAQRDPAEIIAVVEIRNEHLEK